MTDSTTPAPDTSAAPAPVAHVRRDQERYRCAQCLGRKVAMIRPVPGVMVRGECPSCRGKGFTYERPIEAPKITKEQVQAFFFLAGIQIKDIHEIANGYWPDSYVELRAASPWWLVETYRGLIKIGSRKRVIEVDWSRTGAKGVVTEDDVTKSETYVHAWDGIKLLTYLMKLSRVLVDTCPGHVWGDNSHAKHDSSKYEQCSVCGKLQPIMFRDGQELE